MSERLFRGTRRIVHYEDVEVFASSYDEAIEILEEDLVVVNITGERESDWEVTELFEVKE